MLVLAWGLWVSKEFQTVAAGVAIFLFGMLFLEEGFSAFTGGALETVLQRSTKTLPRSLSFGVVSTSVMQSSSLVSVLTISFLSAGLLGLREGIGIIYGANIGTTTGAWLMAGFGMKVKISAYAMPMLVFGLFCVLQKSKALKGVGNILAGMGFLFLGIHFMKEGFESVKESIDLATFAIPGLLGLVAFTLIGVFATVVMQSSHATLMLIIAALAADQITYENALALAIGANIGTTITAILGSLSANIAGKRLAAAHLIFNVTTAAIAIIFIGPFRDAVDLVSIQVGIAEDNWTLKLAVFHTLFNLAGVIVMSPMVGPLVRLLESRIPDRADPDSDSARYLNEAALSLPNTALEVLGKEVQHLFDNAFELIAHGTGFHRRDVLSKVSLTERVNDDRDVMHENVLDGYYRRIKQIYNDIVAFAVRAQENMSGEQTEEVYSLRIACRNTAQAVKAMTFMMPNIEKYADSSNTAIKEQYDALRLHIAHLLRRLYEVRGVDLNTRFIAFDRLKGAVKEHDVLAEGKLDRLVRDQKITPLMATSLMNDAAHATEVAELLIEAGERLWVPRRSAMQLIRDDMLTEEAPDETFGQTFDAEASGIYPRIVGVELTDEYHRITEEDPK